MIGGLVHTVGKARMFRSALCHAAFIQARFRIVGMYVKVVLLPERAAEGPDFRNLLRRKRPASPFFIHQKGIAALRFIVKRRIGEGQGEAFIRAEPVAV